MLENGQEHGGQFIVVHLCTMLPVKTIARTLLRKEFSAMLGFTTKYALVQVFGQSLAHAKAFKHLEMGFARFSDSPHRRLPDFQTVHTGTRQIFRPVQKVEIPYPLFS